MRRTIQSFCLLLLVMRRTAGQGIIGAELPCRDLSQDAGPRNTSDNLSCPNLDPSVLECYQTEELCNGSAFCAGASDEGVNLTSLQCCMCYVRIATDTHVMKK